MRRVRADVLLVERGLAESRQGAQRMILAGAARSGCATIGKPSMLMEDDAPLDVRGGERFVSRGGLKLQAALDMWAIDLTGRDCFDVGASTGGFTDCMLQADAASVLAIDVGHGQMHPRVGADPRVTSLEGVNVRGLPELGREVTFFAVDLSFISLKLVLASIAVRLAPGTEGVVLIKPQFEVGRERLPRGGVVRDSRVRERAVAGVVDDARSAGWEVRALMECPLAGRDGNIEYLAWMRTPGATAC